MVEISNFSDIKGLDDLCQFIDRYCLEFMVPECKFDPRVQLILDLSVQEIMALDFEFASAYAYKLNAYCIFIRKELDKTIAKMTWCEEILNNLIAKHWKEAPEYMKYDVRRHHTIRQDAFATNVEKARIFFFAAVQQTKDKLDNVIKQAAILELIAKRKSYDK